MKIEKKVLNDALRILGKVVCQTSTVEVFRGVRFVGIPGDVLAMATDGVEQCNAPLFSRAALRRSSQKMQISFFKSSLYRPLFFYAADA